MLGKGFSSLRRARNARGIKARVTNIGRARVSTTIRKFAVNPLRCGKVGTFGARIVIFMNI